MHSYASLFSQILTHIAAINTCDDNQLVAGFPNGCGLHANCTPEAAKRTCVCDSGYAIADTGFETLSGTYEIGQQIPGCIRMITHAVPVY